MTLAEIFSLYHFLSTISGSIFAQAVFTSGPTHPTYPNATTTAQQKIKKKEGISLGLV
jgi:hypothetical protein